ncbi:MAG TPA: hypothetical protein P5038_02730 [Candidatus Paceibacterota bacterium]|nr:hypothetical protein [Candidatus Paceibacterota bacterium]
MRLPTVKRPGRWRSLSIFLATISLALSALWEPFLHHRHEQALQVVGLLLVASWSWLSLKLAEPERRSVERAVFVLFLGVSSVMAIFPGMLQPEPLFSASYRGMPRWRGWVLDPNNSGVVLGLACVIALRLGAEARKEFHHVLFVLAGLHAFQLARSFSRIGQLVLVLALATWLCPKWQGASRKSKLAVSGAALGLLLAMSMSLSWLRSSDILLLRRLASVSNVMDLSWANRLYVLPGAIQAMLDRPLAGWGWGEVLPIHRKLYCPIFLPDNTAVLLNDYAHLGASYGVPMLVLVLFILIWCLLQGKNSYAKMTVLALSVAMFFQGVIRVPLTFIPLCISLGLLLGETPPWRRKSWRLPAPPLAPTMGALVFLAAWGVGPLLESDLRISAGRDRIVIVGKGVRPFTIGFVTDGNLADYGREARAAASLGVRAVILHPRALEDFEHEYGTNGWLITDLPGERRLTPGEIKAPRAVLRGVQAVRKVFDAAKFEKAPAQPSPDRPYPLGLVVTALFFVSLLVLIRECALHSLRPVAAASVATAASLLCLGVQSRPSGWLEENLLVVEWANQMRPVQVPDEIYREYVVNPVVGPTFVLRNRREVWHTFYQTAKADDPREVLDRLKESIDAQVLVVPSTTETVKSFDEVWRTRTCTAAERWHLLVAALRTLNIPARIRDQRAEVWVDGEWIPAAR